MVLRVGSRLTGYTGKILKNLWIFNIYLLISTACILQEQRHFNGKGVVYQIWYQHLPVYMNPDTWGDFWGHCTLIAWKVKEIYSLMSGLPHWRWNSGFCSKGSNIYIYNSITLYNWLMEIYKKQGRRGLYAEKAKGQKACRNSGVLDWKCFQKVMCFISLCDSRYYPFKSHLRYF